jgi:ribosomal protein L37AE/L43A
MKFMSHNVARRAFFVFAFCLIAAGITGCFGKKEGADAISSDVHGYYCPKCQAKFYTDAKVFADKCPECDELAIDEVWGHYCTACDALTLAPRSAGNAAVCQSCGKPTDGGIKMPQESDMKSWGAKKADEASVSM